jgi:hypothetical protein
MRGLKSTIMQAVAGVQYEYTLRNFCGLPVRASI